MYNRTYTFYLLVNFMYLFFAPLNWYLMDKNNHISNYVFLYSLITFIILLIIPILLYNFKKKNKIVINRVKPNLLRFKFFFLSLITILILKYLYLDTDINFNLLFNRINRSGAFYSTQLYVIAIIFMQFYFAIFIFNLKYLSFLEKTILLLLFFFFAFHEIVLLGARRFTFFTPVLLIITKK